MPCRSVLIVAGGGFVNVGDRVEHRSNRSAYRRRDWHHAPIYFLEDIEVLAVDNQAQKAHNSMATPPTRFLLRLTMPAVPGAEVLSGHCQDRFCQTQDG